MAMVAAEAAAGRSAAAGATSQSAADSLRAGSKMKPRSSATSQTSGGSVVTGRRGSTSTVTRQTSEGVVEHPAGRPSAARKVETTSPSSDGSQGRTGRQGPSAGTRARRTANLAGGGEFHNYQGIILAEFVAAELLVAMTPIAVRKNQPGLSPYIPRDMTKLVAIGVVFFLLELMAVGGREAGRFGAWFGAIILLGVGLNEANNIVHVLDLFAGVKDKINGTVSKGNAPHDTIT